MARLIDLHIHPTLKMYYLPYCRPGFHTRIPCGPFWNPLSFRTQYQNLNKSPEKVMLCAHYVIERGFVAEGLKKPTRALSWSLSPLFYGWLRMADPWKSLVGMMDLLESSVEKANTRIENGNKRLKMVFDFSQIENLADDEIGMVHAIEGAHALGYGPEKGQSVEDFWQQTLTRLDYLKKRGVSMITLAHFWDNMFCPQTDGTEYVPTMKNGEKVSRRDDLLFNMKRAKWKWGDSGKLSMQFAEKLLEMGILIDVSHCQEHARWAVYELCEKHNRPVIASHVGLQHFFNHEYNLSDAEVKKLHELGGVAGLILSRRWLVQPTKRDGVKGRGIPDIVENMRYIKDLVGDVSCIGIGTDFDGLTDPFTDCHTPGPSRRHG